MDEKLIDAVQKFPCLWNTSLSFYKCNETKDAAWEEIVKEIQYKDVKSAKYHWKQLRDSHRDALKRQKSKKSGQATTKTREWKYQKLMEFLLPYMANRDRESSYKEDISSPNNENDSSQSTQYSLNQDDSSQSTEHTPNQADNPNNLYEIASTSGISTDSVTPSSSKKKKGDELSILIQKHMKNQEDFRKERQELRELLKPTDCDDTDHFFVSMAKTFKKLPDYMQVPLKRKLFNMISEAEESYVLSWYNQNIGYSSSSDSSIAVGSNIAGQMDLPPQLDPEQLGYSSSSGRNTNKTVGQMDSSFQLEAVQPASPGTQHSDLQTPNTSNKVGTEPNLP
nr:uncharacterized protein LOC126054844 [Helicoverpa armigera]